MAKTLVQPATFLELNREAQKIKYWLGFCLKKKFTECPSTGHENPKKHLAPGAINSRNPLLTLPQWTED